jgi:hypothetical protein
MKTRLMTSRSRRLIRRASVRAASRLALLAMLGLLFLALGVPAFAEENEEGESEVLQAPLEAPTPGVLTDMTTISAGAGALINVEELALQEKMQALAPLGEVRTWMPPEHEGPPEPYFPPAPFDAAPKPPPRPMLASPSPSSSFMGLDDIAMVDSLYIVIPPDIAGAVGPSMIMESFNNNYRIRDKATGTTLYTFGTATFWAPVVAASERLSLTDPRTLYDPYNNCWITSMMTYTSGAGKILIAVSLTSDPAGSWYLYRFDTTNTLDFDNLGFNKNWIAYTVNRYSALGTFQRGLCLAVNYPSARAGTGTGTMFTQASNTHFCTAPSVTYSASQETLYLVTHLSSTGATYHVDTITGTAAAPVYTTGSSQTRTGGGWVQPSGNIQPQSAPVSGASACGATPCPIETADSQIRSAVVNRGSNLYYAQTVGLPSSGMTHTGVQWTKLVAAGGAYSDGGRIEDPLATSTNGRPWYAYPHVAVNSAGDFMVGYTQFSSAQHPSAGYSIHMAGDGAGTVRDPLIYHAGEDYYHKTFSTTTGRNRWGDFSTAVVDPTDDLTLWTIQQYAKARVGTDDGNTGTNSSRWSSWWAGVSMSFTITASAGVGGTINPSGAVVVAPGADQGFTIAADPCYDISDVVVDGTTHLGPVTNYTFYNVQANHTIAASFVLKTYTITASAGGGGSINPSGGVVVNCGADQGFAIAADPCYDISDVVVDGTTHLGPVTNYTFYNVQVNHTIAASFVPKTLTITASAGAGGTIDPDGDVVVDCGADQAFTIAADPCYDIADVVVDGTTHLGPVTNYTFYDVQANHTIDASFVLKTYTIAASAGTGGTIDPVGDVVVNCGADQGFTIAANACYDIADVVVDGTTHLGPVTNYTFYDVQANHTIAASFVLRSYTITASAGAGGTIDPVGDVVVPCGADQGFTIAAGPCHEIADVVVDGTTHLGPVTNYTFYNVVADHTITASFVLKTFTITASAGTGGTIDPDGAVVVDCGADQGFAIAANPCYDIADVVVDGTTHLGPVTNYTFYGVVADHTITASFVLKTYTITASAGTGGTIDPDGAVVVNCGADQGFAIAAGPCYDILDVVVDGTTHLGPVTNYSFFDVQANHTIAASFVIRTYTLATSVVGGGSLNVVPLKAHYDCGESVEITPIADPGWQFDHWTGSAGGSDNPLIVVMDADKSITGVFVDIAPPEVLLTSPNGGEVWNVGTTHAITWTATDNAGVTAIDLEYSTDGGVTYPYVIDTGLANSGSYDWLVPNTPTLNARVRVTAHDAAAHVASDASDADFEIHSDQAAVADALLGDHGVMAVYPNPALAGSAHVLFRIPSTTSVDIVFHTISGRMIRRLASGTYTAGIHDILWDGRDDRGNPAAAGVYLVQFASGAGVHVTKRFVLFR